MSHENTEPVRLTLSLRQRPGRTVEQRLAVRFPWFVGLWRRSIARLSPTSRLRQALLRRAMQAGLEAYNRGDFEVVELAFHDDVEFQSPGGVGRLGFQASYRGHEGYRAIEAEWRSGWAALRIEPRELIDLGERLLLLAEMIGRGEGSGISVSQSIATLDTLDDDGKVIRQERYFDHSEALEAAGLQK